MASTSQADFVHWPTTLKLRRSIDRNHKDFLPRSFWEALKPWLCSRASSTKWKSYCETTNLKVLLSSWVFYFFFSSPTLPSTFLLACLFFPPFFFSLVSAASPSWSFLQFCSMNITIKSGFFLRFSHPERYLSAKHHQDNGSFCLSSDV